MRKFFSILFSFIGVCVFAQSVEIVDQNFKQCFIDNYPFLLDNNKQLNIDASRSYKDTLKCENYGIVDVPELIYFDSLTQLELNQNKIVSLPNLDHFKHLKFFYVAENKITKLPSLDSLINLEQLICWKNQLTELPDITHLDKLHRLDVPVNRLTTFPQLHPNAPMKTLLVDDNLITDLPDLSSYTQLQIVKIVNNKMNFDQLEKIKAQVNPSIYDYYPQKFLDIISPLNLDEGDTSQLLIAHHKNANTSIKWIYNNTELEDTTTGLYFTPVTLAHQGLYNVVLHSELFPNQPLYSKTVQVTVRDCPEIDDITVETSNNECITPGRVSIESPKIYRFELQNTLNGEKLFSDDDFEDVTGGVYVLTVKDKSGCERSFSNKLNILKTDCKEVMISPDGDGYQDEFYFSQTGHAFITDKFGNKIIELDLPAYWNGKVNDQQIAPGYYMLLIEGSNEMMGITVVY